jgi:hypothetical protein
MKTHAVSEVARAMKELTWMSNPMSIPIMTTKTFMITVSDPLVFELNYKIL